MNKLQSKVIQIDGSQRKVYPLGSLIMFCKLHCDEDIFKYSDGWDETENYYNNFYVYLSEDKHLYLFSFSDEYSGCIYRFKSMNNTKFFYKIKNLYNEVYAEFFPQAIERVIRLIEMSEQSSSKFRYLVYFGDNNHLSGWFYETLEEAKECIINDKSVLCARIYKVEVLSMYEKKISVDFEEKKSFYV